MSAALQLPIVWAASNPQLDWPQPPNLCDPPPAARNRNNIPRRAEAEPSISVAFYRKHTESMLKRYLYASMQVGRAPSILADSVGRGWASSRPIRTFEDAVIFVLDIEKCLDQLGSLDRQMLSRIVLQEYTYLEAATLIGMSARTISYKFPQALDRLTEKLLQTGLLVIPH